MSDRNSEPGRDHGSPVLALHVAGSRDPLTVVPDRLVVAGFTARDVAAAEMHIAELVAIGVPRPATVPAFYDLDPALLTTSAVIEVGGVATSGEVEPVLIRHGGRFYLGTGSDHTDRDLERADIAKSKAACPKPLGERVVDLGLGLSAVDWDHLAVGSSVDGCPYQDASVASLRHPAELMARLTGALGEVAGDLVVFCGTVPLLGGAPVYGSRWRIHLRLPDGTVLTHAYETTHRSV